MRPFSNSPSKNPLIASWAIFLSLGQPASQPADLASHPDDHRQRGQRTEWSSWAFGIAIATRNPTWTSLTLGLTALSRKNIAFSRQSGGRKRFPRFTITMQQQQQMQKQEKQERIRSAKVLWLL